MAQKAQKAKKLKWLKWLLRRVRDRFFLRKNPYPKGLARHSLGSSRCVQKAKRPYQHDTIPILFYFSHSFPFISVVSNQPFLESCTPLLGVQNKD
jgi:hypothetical protein